MAFLKADEESSSHAECHIFNVFSNAMKNIERTEVSLAMVGKSSNHSLNLNFDVDASVWPDAESSTKFEK
jgi:hypothetical protein